MDFPDLEGSGILSEVPEKSGKSNEGKIYLILNFYHLFKDLPLLREDLQKSLMQSSSL